MSSPVFTAFAYWLRDFKDDPQILTLSPDCPATTEHVVSLLKRAGIVAPIVQPIFKTEQAAAGYLRMLDRVGNAAFHQQDKFSKETP